MLYSIENFCQRRRLMDTPKRYHPALVTLHWLVALLVFTDLYIGYFYIRPIIMFGQRRSARHGSHPQNPYGGRSCYSGFVDYPFHHPAHYKETCFSGRRLQGTQCSGQSGSLFFVFLCVRNYRCRLDPFHTDQSLPSGFSWSNERTWLWARRRISTSQLHFPRPVPVHRLPTSIEAAYPDPAVQERPRFLPAWSAFGWPPGIQFGVLPATASSLYIDHCDCFAYPAYPRCVLSSGHSQRSFA